MKMIIKEFTGRRGGNFASRRKEVEWDLEIWSVLT
jgi:hypothetical protein